MRPFLLQCIIMDIELQFADDERLRKIELAIVKLRGIDWARAGEVVPLSLRDEVLRGACEAGTKGFETRIKAVRDMLRNGRYKPAGRAKPSSEYLLAAALDGSFPRVNPLVDAVNLASLKYMYPMSIFDADRAGQALLCRLGAPGEDYVFNSSGQKIDVEDLVCLCALKPAFVAAECTAGAGTVAAPAVVPNVSGTECGAATAKGALAWGLGAEASRSAPAGGCPSASYVQPSQPGPPPPASSQKISQPAPRPQGVPIVNPVRDSMATKLFEGARNAVIVIYAPSGPYEAEGRDIKAAAQDLAAWCGRAAECAAVEFASLP
jgi:DNA/RNA-binding domain of Phe-tRNA-synthetase-like protein